MRPLCWNCHQTANYLMMNKSQVDEFRNKELSIKELNEGIKLKKLK